MNRRNFLKACSIGALAGATIGTSAHFYLNDEKMERAPKIDGKVLLDAHTHPANYKDDPTTLEMLCSPGIVGLSFINHSQENKVLTYEDTLKRFSGLIEEISPGQLARMKGTDGYFMRTQEITGDVFHILALGCEGDYLPNYGDARKTVEEIHKKNGVAIVNHFHVTPDREAKIIKYRLITPNEEKRGEELLEMVDEGEAFNAQNINPTFGVIVPNMKEANEATERKLPEFGFKGTVTTDAHFRLEQPKICGIYLDEEGLCLERIKQNLRTGNFDNSYRNYVSKGSFVMGMFLG